YAVLCAYSGEEAIEVIFKNKIEVVITDIMMADMNGIDLIKRALKTYSNLECIVITGHKDNELAVRALRAGAFDYLTKPIDLEELTISIKRAIEKINLNLTSLYRNRELTISSEIITRMNEELERRIEERSSELAQTQSQLFQTSKLATLGEMAAGLAHEMNQPLAGISLTSRSIRKMKDREKLTDEELISGLDDIELSVKRMARIIEHIRTFARQDAMKFSEVAVNSTIDSALSLMGEQMRLHGIEIQTDYSPSIPKITGEPFQLEQVWINFLANARDALDGIGDREAGFQKQLRISTSLDPEADMLKVMFSDNGPGIPEDVRDKVMEPFFTTKEVGKGMGLGLSISYGIVDSHQGEIALGQSDIGGAEITVLLPLRVEED
ncbi:MAG: response regulator, partial [Desulfobacterales bacterium]